jgi:[phosphatase 2A protein]-leucine-carboxy methyltransferase
MNLGYFVRSLSMMGAILKFHSVHGDSIQVVVLGCGYDTLFWRLRASGVNVARWFDIDLPHVVDRKGRTVQSCDIFAPLDNYVLTTVNLGEVGALEAALGPNGFKDDLPTVFVDECSLIYVDPGAVDAIIKFAASLKSSGFISYGMIKPDDRFGALMVQNFQAIGAPLKGIARYPTVESHRERFVAAGYAKVRAVDMNAAMRAVLTYEEQTRVRRLEIQDDPDELAFMLAHYVLAIASTDDEFLSILG